MGDAVAAQDEDRHVDGGEDDEQEQDGRVGQLAEVARDDQQHRHGRGADDRDPRRLPARAHAPERRRQDPLARHAVDDPRRHDHVDQRAVGQREQRDRREQLRRQGQRSDVHDLQKRAVRRREPSGRHGDAGHDRDQEIDRAGDEQAAEQRARVAACRVLGLLGDVDRVLEPDQRVERQ